MGQLKNLLSQRGHKLNQYEKKLLSTVVHPNAIQVEFSDLVLSPPTKLLLQTLVTLPLLRPEFFSTGILKRHSIHGVLLFGPPGTGKTMLGKAVAKSGGARFMSIALSDVFDKYVGEGEKNVRAVFTLARKLSPCVVFMDEVDAIFGSRRSDGWHSSRREIINEFMSEWDGLNSNNEGVIIMGATNRPFDLDDAILRRMPRRVMSKDCNFKLLLLALVDLPNEEARRKIMTLHLKDETLDVSVGLDELAKHSANYSGSDLKNLCVAAALTSVKESVKSRVLVKEHFDVAFKEVPPSLTDQTQTLLELRKWDDLYGEGVSKKKGAKKGWGFALNPLHRSS
ncbi:P-loop containing nucleoside triphosphate hydrolase protein [Cladochytrium replicatum]|nr:P-loop containing nucleoside triphosphate hydrolase protein [Cladochytrium replicatum]